MWQTQGYHYRHGKGIRYSFFFLQSARKKVDPDAMHTVVQTILHATEDSVVRLDSNVNLGARRDDTC